MNADFYPSKGCCPMKTRSLCVRWLSGIGLLVLGIATLVAAPADQLFSGLVWRNIGPFRGGRISAVTGAVGQPGVFYAGSGQRLAA